MALLLAAAPAGAQEVSVWADASASHARPPAGILDAEPTTYGLFGGRVEASLGRVRAVTSGQLGTALAGAEGRWLRGDVAATGGARVGPLALRARLSAFGLHYLDPFAYDAAGLDLRPRASASLGSFIGSVRPVLTVGGWSTDVLEGGLRVAGGDMDLERSLGAWTGGVSAGALSVANGVLDGVVVRTGGRLSYSRGRWTGAAAIEAQNTPLETEMGGAVRLSGAVRRNVHLHLSVGRTMRDPLFGTRGTVALSAGVSVRPVSWSPPRPAPVAAVGERRTGGRVVRFALRAPDAREVAVTGDFSGWEPVAMERTADGWRLETVLPPGLHHFGFLVDGAWAVPPDAPGRVEDGWGRRNASIVVEP